ncbi:hypothetical protein FSOLCH5_012823 [Fusarium solani]|nr:hypothetical protein NW759_006353 [Fusarium solani]
MTKRLYLTMKQTDSASTFCGAVSSSHITAFSSHDTILLFSGWLHWAFVDGLKSLFSYFPGLSFSFSSAQRWVDFGALFSRLAGNKSWNDDAKHGHWLYS